MLNIQIALLEIKSSAKKERKHKAAVENQRRREEERAIMEAIHRAFKNWKDRHVRYRCFSARCGFH